jgi:hypothetical protein
VGGKIRDVAEVPQRWLFEQDLSTASGSAASGSTGAHGPSETQGGYGRRLRRGGRNVEVPGTGDPLKLVFVRWGLNIHIDR